MAPVSIFFLGATGYIGSQFLNKLISLPAEHCITALARDPAKVQLLSALRPHVKGLHGSLEDLELLEEQASLHDVVINTASADAAEAVIAILRGQALRKRETGKTPILIETSGTGLIVDNARGLYATDKIYTDLNSSKKYLTFDSLPDSAPHRLVDLSIIAADQAGHTRGYLVAPGEIFGIGGGETVQNGIAHNQSYFTPRMIRASILRGQAGMVGLGKNIWPSVHIADTADLFLKVFDLAVEGSPEHHGSEGYFVGENGEHSIAQICAAIGQVLLKKGIADTANPSPFTPEEIQKYLNGSEFSGTNSRAVGERSRIIGWQPKYTPQDFVDSIEAEVELTLRSMGK